MRFAVITISVELSEEIADATKEGHLMDDVVSTLIDHSEFVMEVRSIQVKDCTEECEVTFHKFTDTPCGRALANTEKALNRSLSLGEMTDLLLDNFAEIRDSNEARVIASGCVVAQ